MSTSAYMLPWEWIDWVLGFAHGILTSDATPFSKVVVPIYVPTGSV